MKENRALQKRWLLVLLAYLFLSVGLFVMMMGLAEFVRQNNKTVLDWLTATIWITAWVCHIVMSAAWIKNKRLGPS